MNTSDVMQAIRAILLESRGKVEMMSQFCGGWEGWLQCELSLQWEPGLVEREVHLWGDGRACDLWFPTTNFCVELKCYGLNRAYKRSGGGRHISNIPSTYSSFASDVIDDANKIRELGPELDGLAVVLIPSWLPSDGVDLLKGALQKEHTYGWEMVDGIYTGLNKKGYL